MLLTSNKYIPCIARDNDPEVYRYICGECDANNVPKKIANKRCWSVYDNTTDEWMPQPSVHAGWQTMAGCQKTCDKLNK